MESAAVAVKTEETEKKINDICSMAWLKHNSQQPVELKGGMDVKEIVPKTQNNEDYIAGTKSAKKKKNKRSKAAASTNTSKDPNSRNSDTDTEYSRKPDRRIPKFTPLTNITVTSSTTVWNANTNAATALFPEAHSQQIQILDEDVLLNAALEESIITARLEKFRTSDENKVNWADDSEEEPEWVSGHPYQPVISDDKDRETEKIEKSLQDDNNNSDDKSTNSKEQDSKEVDKHRRVGSCREQNLTMGSGARMKEQQFGNENNRGSFSRRPLSSMSDRSEPEHLMKIDPLDNRNRGHRDQFDNRSNFENRPNFENRSNDEKREFRNRTFQTFNQRGRFENHQHRFDNQNHSQRHDNLPKRYDNNHLRQDDYQRYGNQLQRRDNHLQRHDNLPQRYVDHQRYNNQPQRHDNHPQRHDNLPQRHDNPSQRHDNPQRHDNLPQRHDDHQRQDSQPQRHYNYPQRHDNQPQRPDIQFQRSDNQFQRHNPQRNDNQHQKYDNQHQRNDFKHQSYNNQHYRYDNQSQRYDNQQRRFDSRFGNQRRDFLNRDQKEDSTFHHEEFRERDSKKFEASKDLAHEPKKNITVDEAPEKEKEQPPEDEKEDEQTETEPEEPVEDPSSLCFLQESFKESSDNVDDDPESEYQETQTVSTNPFIVRQVPIPIHSPGMICHPEVPIHNVFPQPAKVPGAMPYSVITNPFIAPVPNHFHPTHEIPPESCSSMQNLDMRYFHQPLVHNLPHPLMPMTLPPMGMPSCGIHPMPIGNLPMNYVHPVNCQQCPPQHICQTQRIPIQNLNCPTPYQFTNVMTPMGPVLVPITPKQEPPHGKKSQQDPNSQPDATPATVIEKSASNLVNLCENLPSRRGSYPRNCPPGFESPGFESNFSSAVPNATQKKVICDKQRDTLPSFRNSPKDCVHGKSNESAKKTEEFTDEKLAVIFKDIYNAPAPKPGFRVGVGRGKRVGRTD